MKASKAKTFIMSKLRLAISKMKTFKKMPRNIKAKDQIRKRKKRGMKTKSIRLYFWLAYCNYPIWWILNYFKVMEQEKSKINI